MTSRKNELEYRCADLCQYMDSLENEMVVWGFLMSKEIQDALKKEIEEKTQELDSYEKEIELLEKV